MKKIISSLVMGVLVCKGYGQTNTFPSSGNAGIGTTSPSVKLQVEGGGITLDDPSSFPYGMDINLDFTGGWAREYGFSYGDSTKLFSFGVNGSGTNLIYGYIGGNSSDGTSYQNPWMVFRPSGNIGIGTTTPLKRLDIVGDGINLENTTNADQDGIIFKNGYPFISNFNYGDNGTVTTSGDNTFVGFKAGNFTMGSTATSSSQSSYNTVVGGVSFGHNTTGFENTAIGYASLYYNTGGYNNTGNGFETLFENVTGSNNSATGWGALYHNITGNDNTAAGYVVLFYNQTGSCNTANGYEALEESSSGSYNVAGGYEAGKYIGNGSTADTGSSTSVFIGANTKSLSAADNNEIVIGYNATGGGSNSVALGNSSVTKTLLHGNVLIGKTSQTNTTYALDVNGDIRGNKIVVNTTGADYVFDSTYAIPSLDSVSTYIRLNHHLPGISGAKAMEKNGVNLGEAYSKLLAKVEEMTEYLIEQNKREAEMAAEIVQLKKNIGCLTDQMQKQKK